MKNPLATKSLYIGNAGGWRVANNSMMIIQILLFSLPPIPPFFLLFTHINISKDLDFITIFNSKEKQIANFSGLYSKFHLPQMNLTGKVMVAFYTQTNKGNG